jgi:hypothetical protein
MSSEESTEDVFAKLDALLKRHQPGALPAERKASPEAPAEPALPAVVDDTVLSEPFPAVPEPQPEPAETIPTLTEAIGASTIPVLTDVVGTDAERHEQVETLYRLERQLVDQLEERIASQLSATFDRALTDLLETSHTYIEQAVHDALVRELGTEFDTPRRAKGADKP